MSVKLRQKKGNENKYSLYLDIYKDGKRQYEFLKLFIDKSKNLTPIEREENRRNLELAEQIRANRQTNSNFQRHGKSSPVAQNADFIKWATTEFSNRSVTKQNYMKATLNYLQKYFESDVVLFGSLNTNTIKGYRDFLNSQSSLSKTTPHVYFAKFKTMMRAAKENGVILDNPANDIKNVKLPSTSKSFLSIEEIRKLNNADYKQINYKRAFLFCCYTGLRHCDVKRLKFKDVTGNLLKITQHKTNEVLYVPLNDTARGFVGSGEPEERIFKIPFNLGSCNRSLKNWAKLAEINKNLSFHVARHTFATLLLSNGADIATVSKLLGHTTLKYVMVYAKVSDKLKESAIKNLPAL